MCFKDHVAVFADCAINLNPNAEQLAEIAIQSAETAKAFGLEPKVGMLSYSTLGSGKGPDVDLVEKSPPSSKTRLPTLRWSDRSSSTRHGLRPWPRPKPRAIRWRSCRCVRIPGSVRGQLAYKAVQRSSGAAAVSGRCAGSQPPGERSEPWRHGPGHHQHHRPDRHRSPVIGHFVASNE